MSDPETVREIAERWDNPNETPGCVVQIGPERTARYTVGFLLRGIADAMDEALKSEEESDGE